MAQWVRSLDLTTHTSLSPIWRGFAPGFVNYKIGCTRLETASDKVYQLLAHGRWFSPGTPASSTTKAGRHDIAEILLKVALNTNQSINQSYRWQTTDATLWHNLTYSFEPGELKYIKHTWTTRTSNQKESSVPKRLSVLLIYMWHLSKLHLTNQTNTNLSFRHPVGRFNTNIINVKLENTKNNVIPYNNCCSEAKNYTPKQNKNE